MKHNYTKSEKQYLESFLNTNDFDVSLFHHKEHVQVTYTLLVDNDIKSTYSLIKKGILDILNYVGVDTSKYHETMTYAWVLIVNYFMNETNGCKSFEEFISLNPKLLNKEILYRHYSKELINSDKSKKEILEADIQKIKV